jgi:hypothetical protein
MINAELGHCKTVSEFHTSIVEQQEEAHGKDYCAMHKAIAKFWKEGNCKRYMELGTHQGGSASAALLLAPPPRKITLVDIDFSKYNKFLKPLAAEHAEQNNIMLDIRETSSHSLASIDGCDMLVIDSVHKAGWMARELMMHGPNVRKYIIAHDTKELLGRQDDQLHRTLQQWGKGNGFKVVERGETSVGYTVIQKVI